MNERKAVIMAGGEGIRLQPLTYAIPKPLLPIGNYTVLEYLIKRLSEHRITEIFILTCYQHQKFEICREYGRKYGVTVSLVKEEKKMGTIGGIFQIKEQLTDSFLIMNADIITHADLSRMFDQHTSQEAFCTLGVKDYTMKMPYGVVESAGDKTVTGILEKPEHHYLISAGVNMFSPGVFDFLHGDVVQLPDLVRKGIEAGRKVAMYPMEGVWLDIGQSHDYEQAVEMLEQIGNGDV